MRIFGKPSYVRAFRKLTPSNQAAVNAAIARLPGAVGSAFAISPIFTVDTRSVLTGSVFGQVFGSGVALANARVRVLDTPYGAISGEDGKFTISNVSSGVGYVVTVAAPGFASAGIVKVQVAGGNWRNGRFQQIQRQSPAWAGRRFAFGSAQQDVSPCADGLLATSQQPPNPPTGIAARFGEDGTNVLMWTVSEDDGYNDRAVIRYDVWRVVMPGTNGLKVGGRGGHRVVQ